MPFAYSICTTGRSYTERSPFERASSIWSQ